VAALAASAQIPSRSAAGPFILAGAIPFLFVHTHYQPSVSAAGVSLNLSDLAIAVVCITALVLLRGSRAAAASARGGLLALLAFAVVVVAWTFRGAAESGYPLHDHLITAAKWVEYMLLAGAVLVIARRPRDLVPSAVVGIGWSCVASGIGLLQYFGAFSDLTNADPGRRKTSILGYHDFSALSGAALALAFVAVAVGAGPRRLVWAAAVAGVVGMVIGGAFDALLGELLAAAFVVFATRLRDRRRLAVICGALAIVLAGTVAIRSQAVADGLKFLGLKQGNGNATVAVQSYRQRVLLAYIGGRIFLAHPALGVGYDGSDDAFAYDPHLADAHRRFAQPPEAFPSPKHPYGVQNAYVQSLADMGVVGLIAFLAALLIPTWLAVRRGAGVARMAGPAIVLVTVGVWNGLGLVAGIPTAALTWLGCGVCLASVAHARLHESHTAAR
jgi:hypothetical protein